jgi:PAT family beta-lactamase induction signal transducer AmpG
MNKDSLRLVLEDQKIDQSKPTSRSPWLFVPSLYFAGGLPYIIVNTVSVVIYKNMGVDNAQVAFWTSSLYLPWVIKMFWGPLIDIYSTKRNWILYTEFAMMGCLSCFAFSLQLPYFFFISLFALAIAAFVSATQDIAADGFYLLTLNKAEQAFFVGIRSTFYRLAMAFGSGLLVFLAGRLEVPLGGISVSWTIAIGLSALVFAIIFIFHWFILPFPDSDSAQTLTKPIKELYLEVIKTYFSQEKIGVVLAFILLYRVGEAMLVKLASPFLLDSTELGGMGLSTSDVGLAYGAVGTISATVGGFLGGLLVSRYGIRKNIWPMAIALNLPHIFYVYMAYTQPSIELVYLLVAVEQFGYGFGTAAYGVYLMYYTQDKYKTSHFAISTGVMALGMMLPGLVSGYIQQTVGYQVFFVLVFLLTIPGISTLFFIPLKDK